MYALVFALALVLVGCSGQDKPTASAPKVNLGSDGVTSPPGLFPDPSELPVRGLDVLEQSDALDAAAEVLWGSILKTEKMDVVLVRALDGIRVRISGVMEVEGKEHLYLGIDRKDFRKHDIEHLHKVLEQRFPGLPIHLEPSDGIQLLGDDREEETPDTLFAENFTDLSVWRNRSGWTAQTFAYDVPDETEGNKVAVCFDASCSMTTEPMDLSRYTDVTLSFHRWIDDTFDAGDGLTVEVGKDGVYKTIATYNNTHGDDVWHYKTVAIDDKYLGENTTFRFTTTIFSGSDLFSLFTGSEATDEERTAAIDNVLVQGVERQNPDLVVSSVSASPTSTTGGTSVTLRFTVRNDGVAPATSENIVVYRHRTKTTDPTTGGTLIGINTTSGTLAADVSIMKSATVTTPSVSSDTVFHYYVCVNAADDEDRTENNCTDTPATVTVTAPMSETPGGVVDNGNDQKTDTEDTKTEKPVTGDRYPEESYPKPPYKSCITSNNRKHVMGGDSSIPQYIDEDRIFSCGTLTLGGVETKSGTKGFVVSAHVATKYDTAEGYGDGTKSLLFHGFNKNTSVKNKFLGKVSAMSTYEEVVHGGRDGYLLKADAAFVAYPTPVTADCSLTWEHRGKSFCLDPSGDDQIESVTPLTIRGKGSDVYTVIGSKKPEKGLDVWFTGAVSGVSEGDPASISEKILSDVGGDIYHYSYLVTVTTNVGGDSGSPIYTAPDENGNVYIVGILFGGLGNTMITFNAWDDVTEALNLKPID